MNVIYIINIYELISDLWDFVMAMFCLFFKHWKTFSLWRAIFISMIMAPFLLSQNASLRGLTADARSYYYFSL